jgi:hypothetical protein
MRDITWAVTVRVADEVTLNEVEKALHEAIEIAGGPGSVIEIHLTASRAPAPFTFRKVGDNE